MGLFVFSLYIVLFYADLLLYAQLYFVADDSFTGKVTCTLEIQLTKKEFN
jgi:hypothetical protein